MYTLSYSTVISNVINCISYITKFALFQQIIRNNVKNVLYKNAYKNHNKSKLSNTAANTHCYYESVTWQYYAI